MPIGWFSIGNSLDSYGTYLNLNLGTKIFLLMLLSVRMLREELQLLLEQGSYVGEVVKPMDKKKVLVKVCIFKPYVQSTDYVEHWEKLFF